AWGELTGLAIGEGHRRLEGQGVGHQRFSGTGPSGRPTGYRAKASRARPIIRWRRLPDVGPAFREGEGGGAEGPPLTLALPGASLGLNTIAGEPGAERRHQDRAHPVWAVGHRLGLGMDQERIAEIEPGEAQLFAVG